MQQQQLQALDRFVVEQKITALVNRYRVLAAGENGDAGALVSFVQQKRLAFREEILFHGDEQQRELLFRLKAQNVLDPFGRYDVLDADGTRIGGLRKQFGRSLWRSTWEILDADENVVCRAQERSPVVAVARRIVDSVLPGEFAAATFLLPFHFDLLVGDRVIATHTRRRALRDTYDMDLSEDTDHVLDRRTAIALAVALDALQAR